MDAVSHVRPRALNHQSLRFLPITRAEWTKFASVRSNWITLGAGAFFAIGMTALMSVMLGDQWSTWSATEQAMFDPVERSFWGLGGQTGSTFLMALVFAILGVNLVTSEYSSGMMRTTLAAVPRRGHVLSAKLLVVGTVTLLAGFAASAGMFLTGQAMFSLFGLPAADLTDPGSWIAVLSVALTAPAAPVIGATAGLVFRGASAAIAVVVGFFFLPTTFGRGLPEAWQENVLAFSPLPAIDNATGLRPEMILEPPLAALVVLIWLILFVSAAYVSFTRRDV